MSVAYNNRRLGHIDLMNMPKKDFSRQTTQPLLKAEVKMLMAASTRGIEFREYLAESDRKATRKRRWQYKTLLSWFGMNYKRIGKVNILKIRDELERAGINTTP